MVKVPFSQMGGNTVGVSFPQLGKRCWYSGHILILRKVLLGDPGENKEKEELSGTVAGLKP